MSDFYFFLVGYLWRSQYQDYVALMARWSLNEEQFVEGELIGKIKVLETKRLSAILSAISQTWGGGAMSLVGMCHGPGIRRSTALEHLLVVPAGQRQSWTSETAAKIPERAMVTWPEPPTQRHNDSWVTLRRTRITAGEHSYGDGYGCLSCLPRVPIRCRKP
jgi:hypothetical protein